MQDGDRPQQIAVGSRDTPTQATRIVTPALKTKSPPTALRRDSQSFEGREAIPRPKRPTPSQRASGMAMPSGFASNSKTQRTSGAVMKVAPTMISSQADAMTTYRCAIFFLSHELKLDRCPLESRNARDATATSGSSRERPANAQAVEFSALDLIVRAMKRLPTPTIGPRNEKAPSGWVFRSGPIFRSLEVLRDPFPP